MSLAHVTALDRQTVYFRDRQLPIGENYARSRGPMSRI
jgi:hypothetical protein